MTNENRQASGVTKPAAIYARCQAHQTAAFAIERQIQACKDYAQQNGLTVVDTYTDKASGATDNRAGFQQLITDSGNGRFCTVIVYNADRFSRDRYDFLQYRSRLTDNGVDMLSVTNDFSNGLDVLMEKVYSAMARG